MKIGFISLGCPKNLVDSEVMLGLARQAGHTLTTEASQADVLVVNTCAFIDSAKQESIDAILEMASLKRNGNTRLVVTGCLAERYREELQREIPEIDVLLGIDEVPEIVAAIEAGVHASGRSDGGAAALPDRSRGDTRAVPATLFRSGRVATREAQHGRATPSYIYDANTPRVLTTPPHYAYMKIAEGCDYKCAFCIIPTLRGAYRSRPIESLVEEATKLAQQGVRELILISQDTTYYGVDRGERGALAKLLRRLNAVDGLEWIRLLYLYPTTFGEDVMDAMAECEKVCKYVDLPLQHASAPVLKRMKRPGTGATYRRLLDRVRDRVPGVTLRTTFIVGFPGETEAEFGELLAFAGDVGFDHLGAFTYSHEAGTSAFALPDDVPAATKAARRRKLMKAQRAIVVRLNRARQGQRVRLVIDGPAPEHDLVLKGRLEGQAPDIDSVVYLSDCDPAACVAGSFVEARITGGRGYDLVAQPVDQGPQM